MLLITVLIVFTALVLIALLLWLYWRSKQGDQRVINTVNSMLLPILSILVVTINLLFSHRQSTPVCAGTISTIFYTGIIAAIAIILLGCLRFFISHERDRRTITQPVLWATILVTLTFLTMYLNHCI
ncbi:hypothetical protein [Dictyobacter kobayashii]|uniref:Uncharacterized protein n=1 Tax=Dictyobacter kobayashii TaxID=2014872 RepID=A0A402AKH2_9CHLR|nr:hypothetical protein [Dictyobacter kobayashii]GCE19626.1 hypothetical protein KDK_34260 [Dictyobacter kobayashii]